MSSSRGALSCCCAPDRAFGLVGGRVRKALLEMAVIALGDGDRAVAELALDVDQRLAGQQPGGGGRVPERVQRHIAQARVLERLLVPVAGDRAPVHRLTCGSRLPATAI